VCSLSSSLSWCWPQGRSPRQPHQARLTATADTAVAARPVTATTVADTVPATAVAAGMAPATAVAVGMARATAVAVGMAPATAVADTEAASRR
jgi:hypothetical protein